MANEQNLRPFTSEQNREEAKKNGRKGGKASGEARRAKRDTAQLLKMMMDQAPPDKIKRAFEKNGYDVTTHHEAIISAILMGAMKGEPKMVDKALELIGEDYRRKMREAEVEMQKERLAMEKERAELEKLKAEAWMEALKTQQDAEMEDDGFIEALKGTAKEDWNDD